MKTSIYTFSREQLLALLAEMAQPPFRAKQLYEWLYVHHANSFDEMSNLPCSLRAALSEQYSLIRPTISHKACSQDTSRKYIFQLEDNEHVEAVGIPSGKNSEHLTVCFSTQVGCALGCTFCATAQEGFVRNLSVGEIVNQVLLIQNDFQQRVSNVVAMGQGEPFANYDNVMGALRILNNPQGLAIGARHITISSCGIVSGINRLSTEPEQFTLAISLHSALQEKRNKLMPRMAQFPLSELKKSLQRYVSSTNRRVTFEYLLINNMNDQEEDLQALLRFCEGLLCHVNLLPLNETSHSPLRPSSSKTMRRWLTTLSDHHVPVSLRKSRGSDINAACGQLKNSYLKATEQ